jgi:uncharacterized protein YjbI with pentapeptide repeats
MANSQLDAVSLASRIEQLEKRQNITAKYAVGVKRQLDELTEQFKMLQQHFNQLSASGNSFNGTSTTDAPTELATFDDAEVVTQFFEPIEQQQSQEAIAPTASEQTSELVVNPAEVEVNADIAETDQVEETDTSAPEQSATGFTDEEFKTERMMWLVNRIYAVEEPTQEIPISAEEFLERYNKGQRDFTGINLTGVNLRGKSLNSGVNLSGANLRGAELCEANLSSANLSEANLVSADLYKASLYSAKLGKAQLIKANISGADLTNADLSGANLSGADLSKANLIRANLSEANLSGANLNGTNLSQQANLSSANLSKANLSGSSLKTANLMRADLSNANLSNANLLGANLEEANLEGVKLQQALYDAATIFPTGFDPIKAGAYLIAPGVSLLEAHLAGADLSSYSNPVDLTGANLQRANLVKANFSGAKLLQANLSGANLSEANLSGNLTAANLSGANLMQASLGGNFTAADLSNANLQSAKLSGTNFSGANLSGINWVGVDLQSMNLSGANLSRANLCAAYLYSVNLNGANLSTADLRGANLSKANLEKANLKGANISGAILEGANLIGAIMPDGTTENLSNVQIQLNKTTFAPGEEIRVSFVALPTKTNNAWIGIIPSQIPHGNESVNDQHDLSYQWLRGGTSGELVFTAPTQIGSYDFRMNDYGKEIVSTSFRVQ